jgi:hypothetical protein
MRQTLGFLSAATLGLMGFVALANNTGEPGPVLLYPWGLALCPAALALWSRREPPGAPVRLVRYPARGRTRRPPGTRGHLPRLFRTLSESACFDGSPYSDHQYIRETILLLKQSP